MFMLAYLQEETTLNPIPMDLVEPPPVESYLAATKLTALESTIASLQRENEYLVEKCRVISLEKNK